MRKDDMEKYPGPAWLIITVISWLTFGASAWFWAENFGDARMLILVLVWFVTSLALVAVGMRLRKPH